MKHGIGGRGGFTLIEMLATVTLLSLIAGTLTVRLAATGRVASFRSLEARLVDIDERARLFARRGDPVVLSIPHGKNLVELRHVEGERALLLVDLGDDTRLELETNTAVESLVYDRRGTTLDHVFELMRGPDIARWSVSGETGWITELVAEESETQ